jgi:DNA-binding NtrC family response regulator
MAQILIVDDDVDLCRLLGTLLRQPGRSVRAVHSREDALRALSGQLDFDLVLLDLRLGNSDGMEVLRRLHSLDPTVPVIVLSGFTTVERAVDAMKLGAADVLAKAFDKRALLETIDRVLRVREELRQDAPVVVGSSPAFRQAMQLIHRFARPDINVLLLGETGTGKELFARTIHALSRRRRGPFVPVDCSTLAESLIESELFGHEKGSFTGATSSRIGRFELAQGGTLFLDEIGNLPLPLQAKLLRVLQTRQLERVGGRDAIALDVRVVAATNVDVKQAIDTGRFRQDLYFRLQETTIAVPPLRERSGDIGGIADHFLRQYARRFELPARELSPQALAALLAYPWPGNVRELENAMKSAVVLAGETVMPEHLPGELLERAAPNAAATAEARQVGDEQRLRVEFELGVADAEVDLKAIGARAAEQAERSLLQALLRRGTRSGAGLARRLSVDPKTLRLKLRRYGLEAELDARRVELDELAVAPGAPAAARAVPPGTALPPKQS